MRHQRYRSMATGLGAALLIAGCSSAQKPAVATSTTSIPAITAVASTTTSTVAPTTTSTRPPATTTLAASFTYSVGAVSAADVAHSWHAGCPVSPAQLSRITMTYWGFDNRPHVGHLIVNTTVVSAVVKVFSTLFAQRFQIYEMVPVDVYKGDDNAAAAADDTSGFNCRNAVAPGPPQWSVHAYGEAIDVNDVQNPYVDGSTIIPPSGAAYLNRGVLRPGMAYAGGALVNAFASVGWQWGGRWSPGTDYQHFSLTGG